MPCADITDVLQLRIGHDNRIAKYWLRKRSCGGASGERSLIFDWLESQSADRIADMQVNEFLSAFPVADEVFEYLLLKHFFAVQSGVRILLGRETGRPDDFCAVESIEFHPDGIDLLAHLRIDAITDQIQACNRCSSCSTH